MIRLRTLGLTSLADASDAELPGVLRQPKRFALFAYLVLARPRGPHRRDSLLALFWPELDADHARAALRQSLYKLRKHLPAGVLQNRGDEEVGVDPRIWCDVWAFESALDADRARAALELYGGDLLDGLHVADAAPEFHYWLDSERQRLRGLAASAAWEVAEEAERGGDIESLHIWANRAIGLAPLDEDGVRRLLALFDHAGDRAGAIAAYERWASRVQEELDLDPSPETVALVEKIRGREEPRVLSPELPHRTEADAADATGERRPSRARRPELSPASANEPRPARISRAVRSAKAALLKRTGRIAAVAGLVAVIGVLAALLPVRVSWQFGSASPASDRIVILPFNYHGTEESAYLAEGLVYLMDVALDGAGLRTVDPHVVIRTAADSDGPGFDPMTAAELSDRLSGNLFVLGTVVETEGRLRLTATLYDAVGRRELGRASADGTTADVPDLVDQLAADLLTTREGIEGSRVTRLAGVTTASLPALKAYLAGERYLREGRFADALDAFDAAVMTDSLFALAHYRASTAASWAFRGDLATKSAARALRHADRLPERERSLLAAHEAYRRGDAVSAVTVLNELTTLYPGDLEVWYRLGEVLFHLWPLRGEGILAAEEPFLKAAESEPMSAESNYHLAQIRASLGDNEAALGHIRRALDAAPEGARAPQLRTMRALLGRSDSWSAQVRGLGDADDFTVVSSAYNIAVFLGRPDQARGLVRLLTASDRPLETRRFGTLLLAELELALGRVRAAERHLEILDRLDPVNAPEYRALLATAPAAPLDRPRLERLLTVLPVEAPGEAAPASASRWKPDDRYGPASRLYARGLLAAALDRPVEVERAHSGLSAALDSASAADLAADFALGSGSWIEGENENGRSLPPPPSFGVPGEVAVLSLAFSRPGRRYAQAQRLEALGRAADALRWYESLATHSIHDLPWGVPALLDRARLHEMLGDEAGALRLYQHFAELWADADDPAPARLATARIRALTPSDSGR